MKVAATGTGYAGLLSAGTMPIHQPDLRAHAKRNAYAGRWQFTTEVAFAPSQGTTEGRATGQHLGAAHGRLHRQLSVLPGVVTPIKPPHALTKSSLRQQALRAMRNAGTAAPIAVCLSGDKHHSDLFMKLLAQQQAAIADELPASNAA